MAMKLFKGSFMRLKAGITRINRVARGQYGDCVFERIFELPSCSKVEMA